MLLFKEMTLIEILIKKFHEMTFLVSSRVKTDGSYTYPAKIDPNFKSYGNIVYETEFKTIEDAVNFIALQNKSYVYFICSNKIPDTITKFNDASNGYYVLRKYCFIDGNLVRICISTNKDYFQTYKKCKWEY